MYTVPGSNAQATMLVSHKEPHGQVKDALVGQTVVSARNVVRIFANVHLAT